MTRAPWNSESIAVAYGVAENLAIRTAERGLCTHRRPAIRPVSVLRLGVRAEYTHRVWDGLVSVWWTKPE
jgi:hypothetical protein